MAKFEKDMQKFAGKWQEVAFDGFDALLKSLSLPADEIAKKLAETTVDIQVADGGKHWTITYESATFSALLFEELRLGAPRERIFQLTKQRVKSTFSFVDGKLIEEQQKVNPEDPGDKLCRVEYAIDGDGKFTITVEHNGIKGVRKLKRVQ